jgi:hypothetical protein
MTEIRGLVNLLILTDTALILNFSFRLNLPIVQFFTFPDSSFFNLPEFLRQLPPGFK